MTSAPLPLWIEAVVALFLLISAAMVLASAFGLLSLTDYFARMHAPAITTTMAVWCTANAAVLYFSAREGGLALYYWLIAIFMIITVPITTALLARTALFRMRETNTPGTPPPIPPIPPQLGQPDSGS